MPGRSIGGDVIVQNFEEEWEKAERRIQSLYEAPPQEPREASVEQHGAFRVIDPAVPRTNLSCVDIPDLDSKMPGQTIDEDVNLVDWEKEVEKAVQSVHKNQSQQRRVHSYPQTRPGAERVRGPDYRAESPTPTVDTDELQELKSVSSFVCSSSIPPLEAHVVYEDQAWRLEQLYEAVESLQLQQSCWMEGRVAHASEVIPIHEPRRKTGLRAFARLVRRVMARKKEETALDRNRGSF
jgi:hypothetical protein